MRLCLQCHSDHVDGNWRCASCGFTPEQIQGVTCFAPELAVENDGMEAASHDHLDTLQDRSFWFRARNQLIYDLVRKNFSDAERIFELGCGTGYVTQALRRACPDAAITASEIYVHALAHAKRRLGVSLELIQMDARHIPFREQFDLICAFDVLEHIEEDTTVLNQIVGALAPGGAVMLSVPQHPALWSQVDTYSHHKRRYRRAELTDKCKSAGLEILYSTSFVSSLLPLMFLQRISERKNAKFNPQSEHTLTGPIDRTFEAALGLERRLILSGLSLPVGGSRFVLARLPK